jgi:hypothetical protein
MNTNNYPPTLKIGILVFPDFEPIDVWGFIEAFSIARFIGSDYADSKPRPFEIVLISNQLSDGVAALPAPSRRAPTWAFTWSSASAGGPWPRQLPWLLSTTGIAILSSQSSTHLVRLCLAKLDKERLRLLRSMVCDLPSHAEIK